MSELIGFVPPLTPTGPNGPRAAPALVLLRGPAHGGVTAPTPRRSPRPAARLEPRLPTTAVRWR